MVHVSNWGHAFSAVRDMDDAMAEIRASSRTPDILVVDDRQSDGRSAVETIIAIHGQLAFQMPSIVLMDENPADTFRPRIGLPCVGAVRRNPIDPEGLLKAVSDAIVILCETHFELLPGDRAEKIAPSADKPNGTGAK